MAKVAIIGSGFSGLAAACVAAKNGHEVTVFEKNTTIGGRARYFKSNGFLFDMGPSWYWMPDVFEKFFAYFDKTPADYYKLTQLDPGFQIFFEDGTNMVVPAKEDELFAIFESMEKGSALKLKKFLDESEYKYRLGMQDLVYRPSLSWSEYMNRGLLYGILKTKTFSSIKKYVRSSFKDERLIALMEFPVIFLGAMPKHMPSLYSLMNYAALSLGTWYPMGGMYKIIDGMHSLATSYGVEFKMDTAVEKIDVVGRNVQKVVTARGAFDTDALIASADYNHVEQKLLKEKQRNYTEKYWDKKTFAPSCIIYYVGVNKRIKRLLHHNLFFDTSFEQHAQDIYEKPKWPEKPLFYVCCPSKTDPAVAPEGMENIFILIPVAAGLDDTITQSESYFNSIIQRMEKICDDSIMPNIVYKKTYSVSDFKKDYNAYKGNAYGLANILTQTGVLKPSMRNKHIDNMFYTGQLTVPGPGVPPSIISGRIAAEQVDKYLKERNT